MRRIFAAVLLMFSAMAGAQTCASGPVCKGSITAQGSTCTAGVCVVLPLLNSAGSVGVTVSGTFVETLQFETTADSLNWVNVNATPIPLATAVTSTTGTGTWQIPVSGMTAIRVRGSAFTSGTAVVQLNASPAVAIASTVQGSVSSTVSGTAASGSAASGNPVQVGGVSNTALPSLANGQAGALQMDTKGTVYVVLGPGAASVSTTSTSPPAFARSATDAIGAGRLLGAATYSLTDASTWSPTFLCSNTAVFSVASTTTQIVALSGTTKVRVCSFTLNPSTSTAGSVDIVYGTGASCGTGTTTLSGAYTLPASAVVNAATFSGGSTAALTTPAGQAVCVRTVTSTVAGFITYAQF